MVNLGLYPLCSAVLKESCPYSHQSTMFFPQCISCLLLALLGLSFMVYVLYCFTAISLPQDSFFWGVILFTLPTCITASLSRLGISSKDLSLGLLLSENIVLQLFPCFRCLYLFGTFYAVPQTFSDKLHATLNC